MGNPGQDRLWSNRWAQDQRQSGVGGGKARICELEAELAATRLASELFAKGRVVRPKEIYPVVAELGEAGHGLKASCRLLRVSPSGFFEWKFAAPSNRATRRALLTDLIIKIWHESRQTYGRRRIGAELADAHGLVVNQKLVRSIMREHAISGLPKRKKYKHTDSNRYTTEDLVNRQFDRDRPNQLWMTDITEHPTLEGKLYCCAVLDAWSRKVVGWSIDKRATTGMVNTAIAMAVKQRRPASGALIHTDHGPQYTSWAFSQNVRTSGLIQSLGTVGDAFDNAVAESFWGSMQIELLNRKTWDTRIELSAAMVDCIEAFYNRRRRHSSLGYISPNEYERRHQQSKAA